MNFKQLATNPHETSLNKAVTGIGKSLEEAVLYGLQETIETLKGMYYVI